MRSLCEQSPRCLNNDQKILGSEHLVLRASLVPLFQLSKHLQSEARRVPNDNSVRPTGVTQVVPTPFTLLRLGYVS